MLIFCSILLMVIGIQCLEADALYKMKEYEKMRDKIKLVIGLSFIDLIMVLVYIVVTYYY